MGEGNNICQMAGAGREHKNVVLTLEPVDEVLKYMH